MIVRSTGHGVKRIVMLCLLVPLGGCHCVRVPPPPMQQVLPSDHIRLVSVEKQTKEGFERGKPVSFIVRLEYTLSSYDKGLISIAVDQFPNRNSCISSETRPFDKIDARPESTVPISRGTKTIEIPVTWPGDTGKGTSGGILGTGAISIEGSLWSEPLNHRFLTRYFGTEYCMRF